MRIQAVRTLVLSALVLLLSHIGRADVVTFSVTNGPGNVYPFGYYGYTGEYQQVYSSNLFSGPVDITAISFFAQPNYSAAISGDYTLDLSTTSATPSTLSTNYASNIGADNTVFFDGSVSNVLTFTGTPFLYDPSKGDLLLDVVVHIPNTTQAVLVSGCSADTNRAFNIGGTSGNTVGLGNPTLNCTGSTGFGAGLETAFTVTPVASAVPEPSTFMLFGTGIVGVAGAMRRRLMF